MSALAADTLTSLGAAGIFTAAASVLVVMLSALFTASANRRRSRAERYASMVSPMAEWAELPFRIRRRGSDDAASRTALAERMHELQQRFVLDGAEVSADCPWLGKRYDRALQELKTAAAPYITEAWDAAPLPDVGGMNLRGWGPQGLELIVVSWRSELRWCFGWRRLINPGRLLVQWSMNLRGRSTGAHAVESGDGTARSTTAAIH